VVGTSGGQKRGLKTGQGHCPSLYGDCSTERGRCACHPPRTPLGSDRLDDAELAANECLQVNEQSGNREGIAGALHSIGRIELERGRYLEASDPILAAHEIYNEIGLRLGRAGTLADLALARSRLGDRAGAEDAISQAKTIADGIAHSRLELEIREAEREVLGR